MASTPRPFPHRPSPSSPTPGSVECGCAFWPADGLAVWSSSPEIPQSETRLTVPSRAIPFPPSQLPPAGLFQKIPHLRPDFPATIQYLYFFLFLAAVFCIVHQESLPHILMQEINFKYCRLGNSVPQTIQFFLFVRVCSHSKKIKDLIFFLVITPLR